MNFQKLKKSIIKRLTADKRLKKKSYKRCIAIGYYHYFAKEPA